MKIVAAEVFVTSPSTYFGGISPPLKKVMDFAAQYQIKSGFHGPTDISPVGFAAQLHVGPLPFCLR